VKQSRVAVFNDTIREGIRLALERIGVTNIVLMKTYNGDGCVEVNPLGHRNGYGISFPGTMGKLTPEQVAEALITGTARLYYVEVVAEVVPLCK
jgi:hypothetical protein